MKALLIDPQQRRVSDVETDGTANSLRGLIGDRHLGVRTLPNNHELWFGRSRFNVLQRARSHEQAQFPRLEGSDHSGRAVLLGIGPDGDSDDVRISAGALAAIVALALRDRHAFFAWPPSAPVAP